MNEFRQLLQKKKSKKGVFEGKADLIFLDNYVTIMKCTEVYRPNRKETDKGYVKKAGKMRQRIQDPRDPDAYFHCWGSRNRGTDPIYHGKPDQ